MMIISRVVIVVILNCIPSCFVVQAAFANSVYESRFIHAGTNFKATFLYQYHHHTNRFARGGATFPNNQQIKRNSHISDDTIVDTIAGSQSELPLDLPRRQDVLVALEAVRKACHITVQLQPNKNDDNINTVSKLDLSPVTVADFAVQGIILKLLNDTFPNDGYIAEEDSTSLQSDSNLCQLVASATELDPIDVMNAIDLGKSYMRWNNTNTNTNIGTVQQRPSRVWVLDPIDGTRGFLRGRTNGGQYAIALALLDEHGIPVIGVLGCPNLPINVLDENYTWNEHETLDNNQRTRGCIFVASRGGGCYQLQFNPSNGDDNNEDLCRRIHVTSVTDRVVHDARFCIGVERYSDALGQCIEMAKYIHGTDRALDPITGDIIRSRRMDSQAKHGVIARGGAELYVRLPQPNYVEWIWDHAAGNVVIEEAGGTMTDVLGRPIDFSLGAQLSPDVRGVLMSAGGAFHSALVDAYAAVSKCNK
jgi:3'(2'), 5'-bisphosphate nucleotidase